MNNQKEENIRRAIWHIKRHLDALSSAQNTEHSEYELFHLQTSIECFRTEYAQDYEQKMSRAFP